MLQTTGPEAVRMGMGQSSWCRPDDDVPAKDSPVQAGPNSHPITRIASDSSKLSPPKLRKTFVPDRGGDYYRPERDRPYRRVSRSPSPPPLRSLDRRSKSNHDNASSPHLSSSPPRPSHSGTLPRDKDLREPVLHRNWTWKAPPQDLITKPVALESQTGSALDNRKPAVVERPMDLGRVDRDADTVDFNGLKSVPRGPKKPGGELTIPPKGPNSSGADNTVPPTGPKNPGGEVLIPPHLIPPDHVDSRVKRSPHVFIASKWLPASLATVKHLHGCLRPYVPMISNISVDKKGYYMSFEDSAKGRNLLERCYREKSGGMLFYEYSLNMECFPDGNQMVNNENTTTSNGAQKSQRLVLAAHSPVTKAMAGGTLDTPAAHPIIPADKILESVRQSPPLRISSHQDRDDSSSISGRTGSDMSGAKRSKCHVCDSSSSFSANTLVLCSSCPRRYHRRCHTKPQIPNDLGARDTWQCRRCVRKQVHPRSRLSNTSFASTSPPPSVGQAEEPPLKKQKLNAPDAGPPVRPVASATDTTSTDRPYVDSAHTAFVQSSMEGSEHDVSMTDRPPVNSDDRNMRAADDLVEQSFATIQNAGQTPVNSEDGRKRHNLVRRRIKRPEHFEASATSAVPPPLGSPSNEAMYESIPQEPDHPAEQSVQEADTPWRKAKPHKWVGGGADKDIIKAGMENLLPRRDRNISLENVSASVETITDRQSLADRDVDTGARNEEVPESPEEACIASNTSAPRWPSSNPSRLPGDSVSHAKSPRQEQSASYVAEQAPNGLSTAAPHRVRPTNPAVERCSRCNKTIAHNPFGTNNLCTTCKKAANASVLAAPHIELVHEEQGNSSLAGTEQAQSRIDELSHTQGDKNGYGSATGGTIQEKAPLIACETCLKSHTPCNHQSGPQVNGTSQSSRSSQDSEVRDVQMDPKDIEDDLDLWTSKSSAQSPKPQKSTTTPRPTDVPDHASTPPAEMDEDVEMQDVYDATSVKAKSRKKRKSQTRRPINDLDLGSSLNRPKGTYVKLIGMALCASPDHRATGNEVVRWIADNIPQYGLDEDSWQKGVKATMIMIQKGYRGCQGMIEKVKDGRTKSEGYTFKLLPGEAEVLMRWDPELKLPFGPSKDHIPGLKTAESVRGMRDDQTSNISNGAGGVSRANEALKASPRRPSSLVKRSHKKQHDTDPDKDAQATIEDAMAVDSVEEVAAEDHTIDQDVEEQVDDIAGHTMDDAEKFEREISPDSSSDEEPLARRSASKDQSNPRIQPASSAINGESETMDADHEKGDNGLSVVSAIMPPEKRAGPAVPNSDVGDPRRGLASTVKLNARERDYSAKSLFEEWPEYDPANYFDSEAKIAEIKKRPTRKQRFGTRSVDPWFDTRPGNDVRKGNSSIFESKRASRKDAALNAYPWENGESNVIHCDTVEELFNLPKNPIAIIQDGQIAYRDGTRNEDGTLPRAKIIYKTGYA